MKLNDIVVLKNVLNSFYLVLEQEKHLFEIVKIYDGYDCVAIIKSLSTEVEVAVELENIRLATLKERYLVDGNSVIFDNKEYYVAGKRLIGRDNYMMLKDIDDNLKFYNGVDKIDKVIELHEHKLEGYIIWEHGIELTDDEKVILRNLGDKYKYINRREGGNLLVTSEKGSVFGHSHYIDIYNHLFKSITHESGIHEIKELLK